MSEQDVVLSFWFSPAAQKHWFARSEAFDAQVREELGPLHERARKKELEAWRNDPEGALAMVILFDQVPRNLHRNSAQAFATDGLALEVAREAIARGFDQAVDAARRFFYYLPFEHAEDAAVQAESVRLIEGLGNAYYTQYAIKHREIIDRFGRFPHRNAVLGRTSTPEEIEFLKTPGSSF